MKKLSYYIDKVNNFFLKLQKETISSYSFLENILIDVLLINKDNIKKNKPNINSDVLKVAFPLEYVINSTPKQIQIILYTQIKDFDATSPEDFEKELKLYDYGFSYNKEDSDLVVDKVNFYVDDDSSILLSEPALLMIGQLDNYKERIISSNQNREKALLKKELTKLAESLVIELKK